MNRYLGHEGKVQGQIQDYRKGGWGGGLGNCKVLKCIAFTCMPQIFLLSEVWESNFNDIMVILIGLKL